MKIKTKQVIDLGDWDDFIQKTYNKIYSFQQQDGCKSRGTFEFNVPSKYEPYDFENDTIPDNNNTQEMGVSFKAWLERDSKQPLKDQKYDWELNIWWERHFYPSVDMIIEDLYKKGLLKKGEYTINIDW